jgi:hypothetical protein
MAFALQHFIALSSPSLTSARRGPDPDPTYFGLVYTSAGYATHADYPTAW